MNRRAVPLAAALLVAVGYGACSRDEAPPPPEPVAPPPAARPAVPVHVAVPGGAGPALEEWVKALASAVSAGQGHLRLVESPDEALVVVRIDAVETGIKVDPEPPGEGEVKVLKGALVLRGGTEEFSLAYRGEAGPQAEALARNLRGIAVEQARRRALSTTDPPEGAPEEKDAEGGDEG